jgi:hypothetical protein
MIRRMLLAIVPLLVVAGLLEAVLRTTHLFNARLAWTEPDRDIGWRFTPGRAYWFHAENDHPIEGRINAMGWRDRERAPRPVPGTFRVAVIGDSFVEAFQVELDSTFTAIAERRLAASGVAAEVMNFGRSGMSPVEAFIVLERDVLPAAPDLVVFVFTPHNDVADVNPATAAAGPRPFARVSGDSLVIDRGFTATRGFRVREWINPLKQNSALVSLVTERYNAWRLMRSPGAPAPAGAALTPVERLCTGSPDPVFAGNYTLCKQAMAATAGACRRRGARFAAMSVPLVYTPRREQELRILDASFRMDFFDADLAAMADTAGFHAAPLTRAFAARHARTGESLYWDHWNYAGHRVAAGALAELVQSARPGQAATSHGN